MMDRSSSPWKPVAATLIVIVGAALITAVVTSDRFRRPEPRPDGPVLGFASPATQASPPPVTAPSGVEPGPGPRLRATAVPPRVAVDACNRYASHQARKDRPRASGEAGGMGGTRGAPLGDAAALYGMPENKKGDERYRQAYASCMRLRGYAG